MNNKQSSLIDQLPQSFRDWLNKLSPAQRDKELKVAKRNLKAIQKHTNR